MNYSVFLLFVICFSSVFSQEYTVPNDSLVKENLAKWQDLKFGVIIHFGLYSEAGVVESWNLCSEEVDWIPRDSTIGYEDYKKQYNSIRFSFNPIQFDATNWANQMQNAGMKYVIFTTKHHDGFALYDTKFSDFKVTHSDVPYSKQPQPDVFQSITDAFREKNFMIGAYFSKPDWNSDSYWWKRYATPNRHHNYSIEKNPERWNSFKKFTYNQLHEITNNYGKIDILWLDGGWVRPKKAEDMECESSYNGSPDLDIPTLVQMVRKNQPGIIIVDRDVHGENENYRTPEQKIPDQYLPYPWETCMTLGKDWGFTPNDSYKSAETIIQNLVKVVSRGGNFLLGIGPKGDGSIPAQVTSILTEIGDWMSVNGESIYGTKPFQFTDSNSVVTKKNNVLYAFIFPNQDKYEPIKLSHITEKPKKIYILSTQKNVPFKYHSEDKSLQIEISKQLRNQASTMVIKMEL